MGDDTTGVVVEVDDDGVDTTTLLVGDIATLEELGITTLLEVDVTMLLVELVVTVVAGVVDGILEELRIGEDDTTTLLVVTTEDEDWTTGLLVDELME